MLYASLWQAYRTPWKSSSGGVGSGLFKSVDGGTELAEKLFCLGLWPQVEPKLLPFLNAIRMELGLPNLPKLQK